MSDTSFSRSDRRRLSIYWASGVTNGKSPLKPWLNVEVQSLSLPIRGFSQRFLDGSLDPESNHDCDSWSERAIVTLYGRLVVFAGSYGDAQRFYDDLLEDYAWKGGTYLQSIVS